MSIKKYGFLWTTCIYWCVVALLFFFFAGMTPKTGNGDGGGNGTGCGYADSGSGDGAGSGIGTSRTGIGSGDGENPTGKTDPVDPGTASGTPVPSAENIPGKGERTDAATRPAPEAEVSDDAILRNARPFEFKSDSGTPPKSSSGGRKKGFFGVEVVKSGRVIFLVDVSSSMGSSTAEGISRIELLKRELRKVITHMGNQSSSGCTAPGKSLLENTSTGTFRIACFSCNCNVTPQAGQKSWSFSRKADVIAALNFVKTLSAGGGTSMMNAWQTLAKLVIADRVTTVYFLSDGDPTDCNAMTLLDYLQKNCPRVVIHTFSMGLDSQLLENVARQHRGKYQIVK